MAKATAVKTVKRRRSSPKKTTRKRTKKTMLTKMKKLALPAGAGVALYAPYAKRAKETGQTILALVQQDIENFNTEDATERVKVAVPKVAGLVIGGIVIKEAKLLGKYSTLAAEISMGLGLGTLAKAVIDPPDSPNSLRTARGGRIIDMEGRNGGYAMKRNPYDGGF